MQDLFIEFLPPWVETGLQPAFYDRESGTVLQQTARMYAKVNELVKAVNGMDKVVKEYIDYIDNYFKNLDVQEEINNKLDDMAESGDLAEFIALYANLPCVHAYATIADMASSENLADGSYARAMSKTVAGTGDGFYYKIRETVEGDDPDGENLVTITGTTLVAEKIPDYALNALASSVSSSLDTIEGQIDTIGNEINKINSKKTHNIKFVGNDESYYPENELSSSYNGLGFEGLFALYGSSAEISVQGVSFWDRTGKIIFNNGTQIYTLSQANDPTQTVLWTGTYGHGGDSCIIGDNLYIADSENTAIYKVDLTNGNKTTYPISANDIKNSSQNYTPVLAGICADGEGTIYIVACDPENNDHSIKSGSTVRIYTF